MDALVFASCTLSLEFDNVKGEEEAGSDFK
jgi:hypothetical protein